MSEFGFWRRLQARGSAAPSAQDDPFATWERERDDRPPAAATGRRDLVGRLVIGALLAFLITGVVAIAAATVVLDQVFGTAGGDEVTARWFAMSSFGALVGLIISYSWPELIRPVKTFTVCASALVLLTPGAAAYLEARTGRLSYGELHELAQLGGRSVCQVTLPARDGWSAGRYWMLDEPTAAGTLVTSHGGDSAFRHRYPVPMVCLH